MLARSRAWQFVLLLVIVAALIFTHGWHSSIGDDAGPGSPGPASWTAGTPVRVGARLRFDATAYCRGTTTSSGVLVREGVVAADTDVLPEGSVIHLTAQRPAYTGIYTVLDTGPALAGNRLDVYIWSCDEALVFGRQTVEVSVMRVGWAPRPQAGRHTTDAATTR